MPYNLLHQRWIPVRRKSGKADWIAPWQIVERDDAPVAIASARPDFDGALLQFLIGLMQTVAAPEGKRDWERHFEAPHSPEELKSLFASVEPAFNLDGDGPRFMQDLTLKADEAESVGIGGLFIDRMGEESLEDKSDLFAKPGLIPQIDFRAAAAALFTLQTNAPSGGRGHLTSLRGGGPLSTVVLGGDLFATVWLNVLAEEDFTSKFGSRELTSIDAKFPWMAPTRTSDSKAGGSATTPLDVHPAQHYWGMPRRIRIDFGGNVIGVCAITGERGVPVVSHYLTRHSGVSYEGEFRHPLTPYSLVKAGEPLNPKKAKADGIPYRDWPTFVAADEEHEPARVVQIFQSHRRFTFVPQPRLFAFGFEMSNMKPRAWHQGETPLVPVAPEFGADFGAHLRALVEASESVRKTLLQKIKEAIARRPQDLPGDLGATVNAAFWARTEEAFFEAVHAIGEALPSGALSPTIAERWLEALHQQAKALFETYSQAAGDFAAVDVRRVAVAWNALLEYTSPRSYQLRKMVGLPVEERKKSPRKSKKKEEQA